MKLNTSKAQFGTPMFAASSPADAMRTLECQSCHVQLYMSVNKLSVRNCRCPNCGIVLTTY